MVPHLPVLGFLIVVLYLMDSVSFDASLRKHKMIFLLSFGKIDLLTTFATDNYLTTIYGHDYQAAAVTINVCSTLPYQLVLGHSTIDPVPYQDGTRLSVPLANTW